ncbi:DMT family transporter [Candidatus Gottesmanbacteria bacterium]|nr:DMT family transporter [Candidatus Gottesmanbacteria bacterium]
MNTKIKALIALLVTVLIWSVHAIISRTLIQMEPPMLLSLLRMSTAALLFLPFILKTRPWKKENFVQLVAVSCLSAANVFFFMWGIQYTTASVGQLIYAAIPVMMVLVNIFILKEKISTGKITGVLLGFAGLTYIFYLSLAEKGLTITGHFIGNIAIFTATICWLWYIIFSKKLTKYFSPIEIGGVAAIVTCFINFFLAIFEYKFTQRVGTWNLLSVLGGLYMGVGGTFLAYIFYQYAIKIVSTLTVSLSSYIQPITTAIFASMLIGEKLTPKYILGSALVFSGIFLTTTLEVYKRRK